MATFHCFPKLPPELRAMIWAHAVEYRTVDSRAMQADRGQKLPYRSRAREPYTPIPVPVAMQVCRESRSQQLYEKIEYKYPPEQAGAEDDPKPSELRYVWINFEKDMIDIGTDYLDSMMHLSPRVRRLKLEQDYSSSFWYHYEVQSLTHFRNLELCQIADSVSVLRWFEGWEVHYLSCARENIFFIDKNTGEMVNAVQLQEMGEAETF